MQTAGTRLEVHHFSIYFCRAPGRCGNKEADAAALESLLPDLE